MFFNFKTKHLDHVVGFLLSDSFQKQKSMLSTGTTMIGLNSDGLANIAMLKPVHTDDKLTFLLNQLIKTEVALILEKDKIINLLIK